MKHIKKKGLFVLVLLLAIFFRFQNLNWDANMHLHPDERFLTMVGVAMKPPSHLSEYLNASFSTWNPGNIGYPFFVYGLFPVTLNKIIALAFNFDSYNSFTILGRYLSAAADMLVLFFVYKTARLLQKRFNLALYFPVFSMLFYALAVYPIQASHFFTTDTFLNAFLFISFYLSLQFYIKGSLRYFIVSSLLLALSVASKISAFYMFPIVLLVMFAALLKKKNVLLIILHSGIFFLVFYICVRIASPYYFENGDIFDLSVNKQFIRNIQELQMMSSGKIWFPPAVQWLNKVPLFFSLFNLAVVGCGLLFFIFSLTGGVSIIQSLLKAEKKKNRKPVVELWLGAAIIVWIVGYFIYSSMQYAQSIRYLIFLFPFFALLGGYALSLLYERNRKISVLLAIGLLIWPLIFTSIYLLPNTRIQASQWIYQNLPDKAYILSEYWDDPLPYPVSTQKEFHIQALNVFDPDTDEKWKNINDQLEKADYYILSSNRGWASISTVPQKYPKMSRFYQDLFNGNTQYKVIKRFVPLYQSLFPFHPNSWINNWFEEAFTVYDHPAVYIFQNKK